MAGNKNKVPSRIPRPTPTVVLSKNQKAFVDALVLDNKPNLWDWRKYLKGIAVGVGYSPAGVDNLRREPKIWLAARSLVNNIPIIVEVNKDPNSQKPFDPDLKRKPGEPLKSQRQEMFCWEYVADMNRNIRKAAKRAGYDQQGKYGWVLIQRPKIRDRIKEIEKERMERLKVNADDTLKRLVLLSAVNIADFIDRFDGQSIQFEDSNELSRDTLYGVKEIKHRTRGVGRNQEETFTLKLENRVQPLSLLAKHLGLLDQNITVDPLEFATELRQLANKAAGKVPGGEL